MCTDDITIHVPEKSSSTITQAGSAVGSDLEVPQNVTEMASSKRWEQIGPSQVVYPLNFRKSKIKIVEKVEKKERIWAPYDYAIS